MVASPQPLGSAPSSSAACCPSTTSPASASPPGPTRETIWTSCQTAGNQHAWKAFIFFPHLQKSKTSKTICEFTLWWKSKHDDGRSKQISNDVAAAAGATRTWVAGVIPRPCLWTVRAACTTAPSSMSCSTPSASTTNSVAPTGTVTSASCGRTSSQVSASSASNSFAFGTCAGLLCSSFNNSKMWNLHDAGSFAPELQYLETMT